MIIRKATMDDYDGIVALHLESDRYHAEREPWIYQQTTDAHRSRDFINSQIIEPKGLFLIAEIDGAVAGFAYGYEEEKGALPFHRKRTFFTLDNLAVLESHRRQGIGKCLLEEVIAYVRDRRYDDIILNVYCFNEDAIGLYTGAGFQPLTQDMILKLR